MDHEQLENVKAGIKESIVNMPDKDILFLYRIAMAKYPKQMPVKDITLTPDQTRIFFLLELEQSLMSVTRVVHLLQIQTIVTPLLVKLVESIKEEQKSLINTDELFAHILNTSVKEMADISDAENKCTLRSGKKYYKR